MATLICIWDAPGSKLATWPTATFAVYIAIHGHALRHGPPELYSYTALYSAIHYTAIHRYTLYNLYNTPLYGPGGFGGAGPEGPPNVTEGAGQAPPQTGCLRPYS